EVPDSGRRTLRDGALVLSRLEPNDSVVAQCEAHNDHGRLLANAFVYVVGASPPPGTPQKSASPSSFPPHTPGASPRQPLPWQQRPRGLTPGMEPALQDERSFGYTNGTLRLGPAARGDRGAFTCRAHNGHSNATIVAHLDVRGEE
ncbi:NGCA protein, partial [Menura novaehollandiae]|nr:NGCA protein [Menura novaehollandiae]